MTTTSPTGALRAPRTRGDGWCACPDGRVAAWGRVVERRFALALLSALFLATADVEAQPAAKAARIGVLPTVVLPTSAEAVAFREGLRERGWVEGQNLVIEWRTAEGKLERLPDLATELVRLQVDALVVGTNPAISAARQAAPSTPIVFVGAADPIGAGFVASVARPGGNVTGLTVDATPAIATKRLQLLKEVMPRISRVASLYNPTWPGIEAYAEMVRPAARALGLTLQSVEVRQPGDLEGAFAAILRGRAQALFIAEDVVLFTHRRRVIDFAAKHRLPTMSLVRAVPDDGGLMSYSVNFTDLWRRAAAYVDKILKGTRVGDLPVEQPTRYELVLNLRTAKALGLTIPQSVLVQADELIR